MPRLRPALVPRQHQQHQLHSDSIRESGISDGEREAKRESDRDIERGREKEETCCESGMCAVAGRCCKCLSVQAAHVKPFISRRTLFPVHWQFGGIYKLFQSRDKETRRAIVCVCERGYLQAETERGRGRAVEVTVQQATPLSLFQSQSAEQRATSHISAMHT